MLREKLWWHVPRSSDRRVEGCVGVVDEVGMVCQVGGQVMGWRDGRGVAGRETLRGLRRHHHPADARAVFYHLQGKEHVRQHLNRHTSETALFTACPPTAKQLGMGFSFTNKHNSKINISRNDRGGDVAFPGDSDIHTNHWELYCC